MGCFESIGREFARRGWLAGAIDPETFAACRAYVAALPGQPPYDLLCPAIVRADPAEALAVEAMLAAGPDESPQAPVMEMPPAMAGAEDLAGAYGFHRLGPVLAAFAHWVWHLPFVQDQTVVGVMRDGGVLAAALRAVRPDRPVGEVWLGRRLCLTGALRSAEDREGLVNLLVRARARPASVAEAAAELGLAGETLPRGLTPAQALRPDCLGIFLDWVARAGPRRAVEDHCRRIRRAILGHLGERRALAGKRLVLVDVGYAGSVQRALAAILGMDGEGPRLAGAYMVTTPGMLWMLRGGDGAGFLAHLGAPSWLAQPVVRSREVLETLCASPLGPLLGYGDDGQPVLGPARLPCRQIEEVGRVQCRALAFCASGRPPLSRPEAQRAALALIGCPRPEEAAMIGEWLYDDAMAVGRPRRLTETIHDAARPVLWPQGALAGIGKETP